MIHHELSDAAESRLHSTFLTKAETAICFHMGNSDDLVGVAAVHDLVRLPFTTCWFEGESQQASTGSAGLFGCLIWLLQDRKELQGICFNRISAPRKNWMLCGYFFSPVPQSGVKSAGSFGPPSMAVALNEFKQWIFVFLSALNCVNVRRVEHSPDEALQKARKKRGKPPLFSYWTLELTFPKSRQVGGSGEGTHAMPRLHLRRGHPRQYAPSKWCWVQPHVVGDKSRGLVHKDYALTSRA